jgi:hypothetical protein
MPRLESILLHSTSADGSNVRRLLSVTPSRFMANAFAFMTSTLPRAASSVYDQPANVGVAGKLCAFRSDRAGDR